MNRAIFRGVLRTVLAWSLTAPALAVVPAAGAAERESSAPSAGFTFKRGVIVAHWLGRTSAQSPYGGDWFDEEDVSWIAAQGFDHLRIHVDGYQWLDAQGNLAESNIVHFDRALAWARAHRLGIVLTMVSLPDIGAQPAGNVGKAPAAEPTAAASLWRQVARRYASAGEELRFETLEQAGSLGAPATANAPQTNALHKALLAAIRRVDRTRKVHLAPFRANLDAIDGLDLSDPHTVLTLEFFEPVVFTIQHVAPGNKEPPLVPFPGAVPEVEAFAGDDEDLRGMSGKVLTVAAIDTKLARIAAWAKVQPRRPEVYISPFGVYWRADDASARNYIRAVRAAAERHGFGWAVYDYASGMAVRDRRSGDPTRIFHGLGLEPRAARAP